MILEAFSLWDIFQFDGLLVWIVIIAIGIYKFIVYKSSNKED